MTNENRNVVDFSWEMAFDEWQMLALMCHNPLEVSNCNNNVFSICFETPEIVFWEPKKKEFLVAELENKGSKLVPFAPPITTPYCLIMSHYFSAF